MSREQYTACITPKMRAFPKGIPRAERNLLFCAAAKVCAGKASSEKEALEICRSQPPKPPKEHKARRSSKGEPEMPECSSVQFIELCERKLPGMVRSGELPANTDIPGLCQLILG